MLLDYLRQIALAAACVLGVIGIIALFSKNCFLEKLLGISVLLSSIIFLVIILYLF